jgi:hypothetical protein
MPKSTKDKVIKQNSNPIVYAMYYEPMRRIAAKYGYALALHGSMLRDMDMIAVPWSVQVGDYTKMVAEMRKITHCVQWSEKEDGVYGIRMPHGRRAYRLFLGGVHLDIENKKSSRRYIDLSIVTNHQIPKSDQQNQEIHE